MRTVEWNYSSNCLRLIDQRVLPGEFRVVELCNHYQVADAISDMVVRGAPAIGATAAFGLALAALNSHATTRSGLLIELNEAGEVLVTSRPTAVNLSWAIQRILRMISIYSGSMDDFRQAVLAEAQRIANEDVELNKRMAQHGAALIQDGDTIIHHCNTGALATVDWGTALGVIRMAHEQGKQVHVLVDETRPRLQGARLTAWELQQYDIPFDVITDNAAGYYLSTGQVQKVLFGADRVTANGDVANKIGTYMLALAAHDNNVPVYPIVPTPSIDLSLARGEFIPIEERHPSEVLNIQAAGKPVFPSGATARNPAFDVTPFRLVTAIVTENGVVYPPFDTNLTRMVRGDKMIEDE
jgi:methylthioribose-1-phosphate isomerase